ncbi:MAG TPA: hypothetical protein PKA58_07245 [Polyangium sp.]|nr:hypothetical protein [Polyangium sp.]
MLGSIRSLVATTVVILLVPSAALAADPETPPASGDAAAAAPAAPPPAAQPPAAPAKEGEKEADPKTRPAPNSVFAEMLGAGVWYSVNYERRVIDDLGVRAGLSYMAFGASVSSGGSTASAGYSMFNIPVTAEYLGVRKGKHGLEAGGGVTLSWVGGSASVSSGGNTTSASGSVLNPFGTVFVGYRLHPVGRAGFQFRIGAMGLIGRGYNLSKTDPAGFGVLPYGYMSLGGSF